MRCRSAEGYVLREKMDIIGSHARCGPSVTLEIKVTTEELLHQAKTCGVDGIGIFPSLSQALADEGINDEVLRRSPCHPLWRRIPLEKLCDLRERSKDPLRVIL